MKTETEQEVQAPLLELTAQVEADLKRIIQKSDKALSGVKATEVTNEGSLNYMEGEQVNAKGCIKDLRAAIKPYKDAAKAEHSRICSLENQLVAQPIEIFDIAQGKVTVFRIDARRKQIEEEARLKAQKERVDLVEAEMIEERDGREAADAFMEQAESEPAPVVTEAPKSVFSGTSMRYTYSAVVVDEDAVPIKFRPVDIKLLNGEARNMKERFSVDGCKLVKTPKNTVRT